MMIVIILRYYYSVDEWMFRSAGVRLFDAPLDDAGGEFRLKLRFEAQGSGSDRREFEDIELIR